jgi:hypothetical protein
VARGRLRFRLRNDKNLKRELRAGSLANNIFKNKSTPKTKTQERRPRKGRHGGDRAVFATPSQVPSKEKNAKEKSTHYYEIPETVSIWLCNFNVLKQKNIHKDI